MNGSGWNMYVFRNGRQTVSGSELVSSLSGSLLQWMNCSPSADVEDAVVAALIAAGELECALLDDPVAGSSDSCNTASQITDRLAEAFLTRQSYGSPSLLELSQHLQVEGAYEVAVQEGFAYYALHPRKVAILLDQLALNAPTFVIGIRSIGVTLSAVACASLRLRGIECQRITVRPTGHPYDRRLEMTAELCERVRLAQHAKFLIIDEGPGISGSSFLSVAEALESRGIERQRIHMIGSRFVDPASLRAENAAKRWSRYAFQVMLAAPIPPTEAGESISGGTWRRLFHWEQSEMPASWTPLEPAKFLSADERSVFKFAGFGHYGESVSARAELLAQRGFSPRHLGIRCGFGQSKLVRGKMLGVRDGSSSELLKRMAEYLTFRSAVFQSSTPQTAELETMLRWNWQLEFGEELSIDETQLRAKKVVVCDACMMPQKWLRPGSGELLKLDANMHGDNHFFPGPCDIAWDVAGAIVEWEMFGEMREAFVREYESQSGDAITDRLAPYLLAYVIFRLGWSKMASLAMQGEFDEALLIRDYKRYRAIALRLRQEQTLEETRIAAKSADSNVA